MLKTFLFASIEKSVNFILSRDEDSHSRLAVLEDKTICIELNDLNLTFYWLFEHHRVRIVSEFQGDCDATISGPFQAIARMGLTQAKVAKDLTVSGDMHVVEAFKELFAQLDIDWEAQIAPYTGDAGAYKIGKTLRQTGNWLQQTAKHLRASTKEYVEEEANILPSKLRFTDFSKDVRELNRDVDRLSAKIKRLQPLER